MSEASQLVTSFDLFDPAQTSPVIAAARQDLDRRGAAIVPGFLSSCAVRRMVAECDLLVTEGHFLLRRLCEDQAMLELVECILGRSPLYRYADPLGALNVASMAAGDRFVRTPMTPGTLLVFAGRNSLHRVTPIGGDRRRDVALLAYDTRPDTDSSDLLKLIRYGRLP